jgi:diguanylate cyclase (GGDEF)-like protein
MAPRILGYCLLALQCLAAMPPARATRHYSFKQYAQEDGLANLAIYCMLQDRTGFIWVGTENGLYRYDGRRFRRYTAADGLPGARIVSLHQSADGILWAVTNGGLAASVDGGFKQVPLGRGVPQATSGTSLASDARGTVFVTNEQGLFAGRQPSRGPRVFRQPSGSALARAPAGAVTVTADQTVYFGCGSQLCTVQYAGGEERIAVVDDAHSLPAQRWETILVDGSGALWLRSITRMYRRAPGATRFSQEGAELGGSAFATLYLDSGGALLASTDSGLARHTAGGWEMVDAQHGLPSDSVCCMLQDHEGSMWVGLQGRGVAQWLGYGRWDGWTRAEGLPNEMVWSLLRDRQGRLWAGTDVGLSGPTTMTDGNPAFSGRLTLLGHRIRTAIEDPGGTVWTGEDTGLLCRSGGGSAAHCYGAESGLPRTRIYGIAVDSRRRIWITTRIGIYRSDAPAPALRFHRMALESDEPEAFVDVIAEPGGRVWAAGAKGLAGFEDGRWRRITERDGLAAAGLERIARTPDGSLWVSYSQPIGLAHIAFSGGRAVVSNQLSSTSGGPVRTVFLGADAAGGLWQGTDMGVNYFANGRWTAYRRNDGLIWDDCNAGAFFADPDGSVWIGTSSGIARFRPDRNRPAPAPPLLVLTAAAFGTQDLLRQPVVPFADEPFRAEFAALTFRNEPAVRLRFRLIGYRDSRWIDTDQRSVLYTSLPAGEYTLETVAGNADGNWTPQPVSIRFRILEAWWLSWWFRLLQGALLLALMSAYLRLRLRKSVARQRSLEVERGTERQRNRVLEMVADNQPLAPILDEVRRLVEAVIPSSTCVISIGEAQSGSPSGGDAAPACRQCILGATGETLGTIAVYAPPPGAYAAKHLTALEDAARLCSLAAGHQQLYERLNYQAYHDALTGLPNRRLFADRLQQALNRACRLGHRVGVLYLDLDRFKQINDTLSHRVGDLFLQEVSRNLREALRSSDTLARMGGDEFTVVLDNVHRVSEISAVAGKLLDSLHRTVRIEDYELAGSGSIGISVFPDDGQDAESLQKNADAAMYLAKSLGKNRYEFFSAGISEASDQNLQIDQALRRSLAESLFELRYQPQVGAGGELRGMEALLRSHHPLLAKMPAGRFIAIAEESDLIVQIGDWVLRTACQQAAAWAGAGLDPVRIAVNVSARQFARPAFSESVAAAMREAGISGELLEVELTESSVIDNVQESCRQMERLRSLGVRLALDDFGTGYSSLSWLHQLPIDAVKIDQAFVRDMFAPTSTLPLVGAIIAVAKSLHLEVVAEGVETERQVRALREAGCDALQGYLFSRPVPPAGAEEWLRTPVRLL